MKVFLNLPHLHHMNEKGLKALLSYLDYELVKSKRRADIIYSPSKPLNTRRYPGKVYIFGPHFSVFPNKKTNRISNELGNAVYILPSTEMVQIWKNEFSFKNLPIVQFPFPLVMKDYPEVSGVRDQVLVYYKMRDPEELKTLLHFLDSLNENYKVIKYWHYKEEDYQKELERTKFVIWLGCHESQGFALQSALARNIPVLCWSVKYLKQEWGSSRSYEKVTTEVSSAPYWDKRCGIKVYDFSSLRENYSTMANNYFLYSPRDYIKENLTVKSCAKRLLVLIEETKKNMLIAQQNKKLSFKDLALRFYPW